MCGEISLRGVSAQRLSGVILLILMVGGGVAHAQVGNATIDVCNQGSIAIDLFSAREDPGLLSTDLQVYGWTQIGPGSCQQVYWAHGSPASVAPGVYLGFVSVEHGEISGYYVDRAPDLGDAGEFWDGFSKFRVLALSNKQFCVSLKGMNYSVDPHAVIDCSSFHPANSGYAQHVGMASALYFQPRLAGTCGLACPNDGKYFVRVAPNPNDHNLHATAGTGVGEPVATSQNDEAMDREKAKAAMQRLLDHIAERNKQEAEQQQAARQQNQVRNPTLIPPPADASTAANAHSPGYFGDLIGPERVIKPYSPPPAAVPDAEVEICVPSEFVEKYSWETPAPGSDAAQFKDFILSQVGRELDHGHRFRITDRGFDLFVRGTHAEAPYTIAYWYALQPVPSSEQCPATSRVYRQKVRAPS